MVLQFYVLCLSVIWLGRCLLEHPGLEFRRLGPTKGSKEEADRKTSFPRYAVCFAGGTERAVTSVPRQRRGQVGEEKSRGASKRERVGSARERPREEKKERRGTRTRLQYDPWGHSTESSATSEPGYDDIVDRHLDFHRWIELSTDGKNKKGARNEIRDPSSGLYAEWQPNGTGDSGLKRNLKRRSEVGRLGKYLGQNSSKVVFSALYGGRQRLRSRARRLQREKRLAPRILFLRAVQKRRREEERKEPVENKKKMTEGERTGWKSGTQVGQGSEPDHDESPAV
ncbi:hypothetical protein KM043_016351 [Ampulex compressa]|nr:hypothetical protein KM043_016351 [Ampulex compressa]